MKILLLGGSGQLGYEVITRAHDLNFEVVAPVSSEVDVANFEQLNYLAHQVRPDILLNCAAYTAVDKAETERERCFRINRDGAACVARVGAELQCRVIFVSTDYVFAGDGTQPLDEDMPTGPRNVYGESKLAGEQEMARILGDKGLVVRTSSLHGQRGVNFVNTMLNLFRTRPEVKVVSDQVMSPTWAGWLAEVLLDLSRTSAGGVVHASGDGAVSWLEFARAIHAWSTSPATVQVQPITTEEFGRPAKRPMFSAFNCRKLAGLLGRKPIPWQEGLKRHLREVGALKGEAC